LFIIISSFKFFTQFYLDFPQTERPYLSPMWERYTDIKVISATIETGAKLHCAACRLSLLSLSLSCCLLG
jgi:hypothetical protein